MLDKAISATKIPFRKAWIAATLAAVAAGVYLRLSGIGKWPLAADEYFIYRSMNFILESGLPGFACGGYYARGLLYQYFTALFLHAGIAPEVALRVVSAISNLLMLPMAFLLSRKIGGRTFAFAVVIILSLSTWEIEMSRFGRMYAPFQAVFIAYMYHAYRLIQYGEESRWRWLIGLSVVGMLLWEGALFLALANFLPFIVDRKSGQVRHLVAAGGVLTASLLFLTTNFRRLGSSDEGPAQRTADSFMQSLAEQMATVAPLLMESPAMLAVFMMLTLALVVLLLRAILFSRLDAFESLTLLVSCIALILNQLLLVFLVLTGAAIVGWVRPETLSKPALKSLALVMGSIATFFLIHSLVADSSADLMSRIAVLLSFPDLLYSIVYPWLFAIPAMSVLLAVSVGIGIVVCVIEGEPNNKGIRLLLTSTLLAVVFVSVVPTLYHETRYSFFLYPLAVCLAGFAPYRGLNAERPVIRFIASVFPALCIAVFAIGADFDFRHLQSIDSYNANFRVGYDSARARHYYPRSDYQGPADFISHHAADTDTVIVSHPAVTHYVPSARFIYIDARELRFRGHTCPDGSQERWTGLPLLPSVDALAKLREGTTSGVLWVVLEQRIAESEHWQQFLLTAGGDPPAYRSNDGSMVVYRLPPYPGDSR